MRTFLAVAAVALVAACASETPVPAAAPSGIQATCTRDSECPKDWQCERGHCLKPNDVGPATPQE